MNILWINHIHLNSELCKTSRMEMINALSKSGNTIYFTVRYSNPKVCSNHIYYLPSINTRYFSSFTFCLMLLFYLPIFAVRKKIDVIIVDPASSLGTLLILIFLKFRIFLDIRSPPVDIRGVHGFLTTLQYKFSLFFAKNLFDGMTVITSELKEEICKEFGVKPYFVGVWTSGVSTSTFSSSDENDSHRENLRRSFGLSDKFVLMYHGILSPNRGLQETIEAVGILKDKYPNIVFFMLGSGSAEEELRRLIDENLQDKVFIQDPVDYSEVPRYISMCDVGIVALPIHRWWRVSSPLKLLEYLAMEKPVVATDLPFHRKVTEEGGCGVLIPSNSPIEIAKAIEYLYRNRKLSGHMGKNGRRLVETKYTWEAKAQDLEEFINRRSRGKPID